MSFVHLWGFGYFLEEIHLSHLSERGSLVKDVSAHLQYREKVTSPHKSNEEPPFQIWTHWVKDKTQEKDIFCFFSPSLRLSLTLSPAFFSSSISLNLRGEFGKLESEMGECSNRGFVFISCLISWSRSPWLSEAAPPNSWRGTPGGRQWPASPALSPLSQAPGPSCTPSWEHSQRALLWTMGGGGE